jgi:DNA repair protein RadA/Sms
MKFVYNKRMKLKTLYVCSQCEHQTSKWLGKCPKCQAWNSFVEDVVNVGKAAKSKTVVQRSTTQKIGDSNKKNPRLETQISELDSVLGGGFVHASLTLLSGQPGIGKSTLTLQIVDQLAKQVERILYVTGEESVDQVASRGERLGCTAENLELCFQNNIESIIALIEKDKPAFLVVDSIQVMSSSEIASASGSLSQVRFVTEVLMNTIKRLGIPTLLIGHVNKDGNIAGPKVLEHLVDTVLVLEGERDRELRMLRSVKNRFGSVSEVGLFEMAENGLRELKNPGEALLKNRPKESIGSCLTMSMEGQRPLLMEVQALVSRTAFGYPKRAASGFDRNRLELLCAVLQKHCSINLSDQDIYINVVGGLRIQDRSADLAVCLAILSSLQKQPVPQDWVAYGELGLTGEIRAHWRAKERNKAIEKLGLSKLPAASHIRQLKLDTR